MITPSLFLLQFIVNDEYTLRELGVDEAKLFVHAVAVAGTALVIGSVIPVTLTIAGSLAVLYISNVIVWGIDQVTDFEKQLVEYFIE